MPISVVVVMCVQAAIAGLCAGREEAAAAAAAGLSAERDGAIVNECSAGGGDQH